LPGRAIWPRLFAYGLAPKLPRGGHQAEAAREHDIAVGHGSLPAKPLGQPALGAGDDHQRGERAGRLGQAGAPVALVVKHLLVTDTARDEPIYWVPPPMSRARREVSFMMFLYRGIRGLASPSPARQPPGRTIRKPKGALNPGWVI
jgi:hypothetical protein